MTPKKTIAVIAATGGVGQHVVQKAIEQGYKVHALARSPEKITLDHPLLTKFKVDVQNKESLLEGLKGVDVVLSCLGNTKGNKGPIVEVGTQNIIQVMEAFECRQLAIISSIGVGDSAKQLFKLGLPGWIFSFFFHTFLSSTRRDLNAGEQAVAQSGLNYVIVRPSGLSYKAGIGSWQESDAKGRVGSLIAREDVALCMLDLVTKDRFHRQAISIGN